jgi:hypothetical protein
MATNQARFIRNIFGLKGPFKYLGLFQAGGTQAIKQGEMLKIDTGNFVPITADYNSSADLAIADEEIKSGDYAGYYWIIVPRPGDIFEFDLDSASAITVGTNLQAGASNPTESFQTGGSNHIAKAVGQEHYPNPQGHASDDASPDEGSTVRSTSKVRVMFEAASSYYSALQS